MAELHPGDEQVLLFPGSDHGIQLLPRTQQQVVASSTASCRCRPWRRTPARWAEVGDQRGALEADDDMRSTGGGASGCSQMAATAAAAVG